MLKGLILSDSRRMIGFCYRLVRSRCWFSGSSRIKIEPLLVDWAQERSSTLRLEEIITAVFSAIIALKSLDLITIKLLLTNKIFCWQILLLSRCLDLKSLLLSVILLFSLKVLLTKMGQLLAINLLQIQEILCTMKIRAKLRSWLLKERQWSLLKNLKTQDSKINKLLFKVWKFGRS